jgi:glycosyltransferase involved in cell wall biosynthesis
MDGLTEKDQRSMSPQVSVVMGVHNGESHLPATMDSIFNQQDIDFELVVVDDGSTDGTAAILAQWTSSEPRIKIHRQEKNGLTRALITGCSIASGDFIARQDVGDLSHPLRLKRQHDLLAAQPALAFVSCQCVWLGPSGEIMGDPQPADAGRAIIKSLTIESADGMDGPNGASVMFRRSAYERVGGFRPEFYFAQDLDLWSRLIEIGDLAFIDDVLYETAFAPGDISARYRDKQLLLRDLVFEATQRRRSGLPEDDVLRRAALVRPEPEGNFKRIDAAAEYFIGSCLYAKGDPAAVHYLRRAIAGEPFHLKAWAKLLFSSVLHRA